MKKILLSAIAFLPLFVTGQTIFSDDFESYTPGDLVAATSPVWTTWSGGIPSEDAVISDDQAASGSNSAYVIGNVGPTDLVLPFPSDYTTGIYELSLKLFIVSGKGAYYNFQQSAVPGVDWMFEVYYDNAGGGEINAGGTGVTTVSYTPDTWTDNKIVVDLTNDEAEFFVNDISVYSWQWSLGATGAGSEDMWGGMDIFAAALNNQDAEFYVDDVVLSAVSATGIPEESVSPSMQVYPNPSNGRFSVVTKGFSAGEYQVDVVDVLGNIVNSQTMQIAGSSKKDFHLELAKGVYFVRLNDGTGVINRKLIMN